MLENAATPISKLHLVKNGLEQTNTGQSLTYDKYLNFLLSVATAYENQSASKKPKRNVLMHITGDSDDDIQYSDISNNINAPVSIFFLYALKGAMNPLVPLSKK
jgi:hypothetical protein